MNYNLPACSLIANIPNHSTGILRDNSLTELSDVKTFALFVAECLIHASKVFFMFKIYQGTEVGNVVFVSRYLLQF